jgi:hypothetical protein
MYRYTRYSYILPLVWITARSIGRPVIWSIEMYRYTRYSYILPLVWITARRIGRQGITFGPQATGAGRF